MIDPRPVADPAPHDDLERGLAPTPSAAATSLPPSEPKNETLDPSVIATFRDPRATGPDFAVILIDQFLEEATSHMQALKDAVGRLDGPALKTTAHTLKGTSMTIGATHLAALSGQMETRPPSGVAMSVLMAELEQEFVEVRGALAVERKGTGTR